MRCPIGQAGPMQDLRPPADVTHRRELTSDRIKEIEVQRVVVLRDGRARGEDRFGNGVRGYAEATRRSGEKGAGKRHLPKPSIEIEEVDRGGRSALLAQRDVAAVAPMMPTRLIEPRAADGPVQGSGVAWGVEAVGASGSSHTGDGVVVAVLDTGVDASHQAFDGVIFNSRDFTRSTASDGEAGGTDDRSGHGTHCAGTILGRDVNGVRIGVARGITRALAVKVLPDEGFGTSGMLFNGLRWAIEQGANIVSMSLGLDFPKMVSELVDDGWPVDLATSNALEAYRGNVRLFDRLMHLMRATEEFTTGTVVVAAAGNESRRDIDPAYTIAASLPAAADGIISVGGAGRSQGRLAVGAFSNTFPRVTGPGVDITSARAGDGLVALTGTSMACPHVAGVAALWWEAVRDGGLVVRAETVVAQLLARARTDVFDPDPGPADRGAGLVTAP